ncbi:MAG: VOC family protein [bacterium]
MTVPYQPANMNSVMPYLLLSDLGGFLQFATEALGATIIEQMGPPGSIMHAEIKIGDSVIMMGPSNEQWPSFPAMLYVYVPDCDAIHAKAMAAGSTEVHAPKDEFYGDRSGCLKDKWGNVWCFSTHIEDVTPAQMMERMAAGMPQ